MTGQKGGRGVADIVFLLDCTGSMASCIEAVKNNVSSFIQTLTTKDANNTNPVKDWRAAAYGYRDFNFSDSVPFIANPFVRKPEELIAQLATLRAEGGHDEPESALDAIYRLAKLDATSRGEENPTRWRYRSEAARIVVLLTDATFHPVMSLPEAKGGTITDVFNVVNSNRIILIMIAPSMACYDELSAAQRSEYEAIELAAGESPQDALDRFTKDTANFRKVMEQLAKSISASAAVDPVDPTEPIPL
jgi:hypothetical protein